jgi:hypothetical protein
MLKIPRGTFKPEEVEPYIVEECTERYSTQPVLS